ncbi:hypothetical protein HYQ46_006886 [Verticillium longisporum]|nr:hypothetical protein HYQ46_006886 [Verticillium longisporum]
MSLPNTFVYMQFHPLTYIVKLNIEMIMADLIGKIARNRNCGVISEGTFNSTGCDSTLRSANVTGTGNRDSRVSGWAQFWMTSKAALWSGIG